MAAMFSYLAVLGVGTVLGTQATKTGDKWATRKEPVSDCISLCGEIKYLFCLVVFSNDGRTHNRGNKYNGTHIRSISVSGAILRSILIRLLKRRPSATEFLNIRLSCTGFIEIGPLDNC